MTRLPERLALLAEQHLPNIAAAEARWAGHVGRVRIDRATRRLGTDRSVDALDMFLRSADLGGFVDSLGSLERDALIRIDRQWPEAGSRLVALADRALSETALAFRLGDAIVVHPIGLTRTVAAIDPGSNFAWLLRHLGSAELAAAAAFGADGLDDLLDAESADVPPVVLRRRTEASLRAADAPPDVAWLAAHVRGAIVRQLDHPRALPLEAIDWLIAPPDQALTWQTLLPAPLCLDDRSLIALLLGPTEYDVSPEVLAGAVAGRWRTAGLEGASALLSTVPIMRRQHCRLLALGDTAAARPLDADAVRRTLLHHAAPPPDDVRSALLSLCPDSGDAPRWVDLGRVALHPSLPQTVADLMDEPVDWFHFDAPGEGRLPDLWLAALVLAGPEVVASARPALRDRLPDDALQRLDIGVDVALGSLRAEGETETRSITGHLHGLNDAIAEAYGDVYAPTDPFSVRRPARR